MDRKGGEGICHNFLSRSKVVSEEAKDCQLLVLHEIIFSVKAQYSFGNEKNIVNLSSPFLFNSNFEGGSGVMGVGRSWGDQVINLVLLVQVYSLDTLLHETYI